MTLNERLVWWHDWAGLSVDELASALSVTAQAVKYWRSGTHPPSHAHLHKFTQLVGISMAEFWGPLPKKRLDGAS